MDVTEGDNAAGDSAFCVFDRLGFQAYPFVFVVRKTPQQFDFDRVFIVLGQRAVDVF